MDNTDCADRPNALTNAEMSVVFGVTLRPGVRSANMGYQFPSTIISRSHWYSPLILIGWLIPQSPPIGSVVQENEDFASFPTGMLWKQSLGHDNFN